MEDAHICVVPVYEQNHLEPDLVFVFFFFFFSYQEFPVKFWMWVEE